MANPNPNMSGLKPLKKGDKGRNPKGKPRRLVNVIKGLPEDAQESIYKILTYCLTLPDETAAKEYLKCKEGELGKYGFVMQIAIKQLTAAGWGFGAMMDILDRVFGKPRIQAEVTHNGGITLHISTDEETKELIEGGLG